MQAPSCEAHEGATAACARCGDFACAACIGASERGWCPACELALRKPTPDPTVMEELAGAIFVGAALTWPGSQLLSSASSTSLSELGLAFVAILISLFLMTVILHLLRRSAFPEAPLPDRRVTWLLLAALALVPAAAAFLFGEAALEPLVGLGLTLGPFLRLAGDASLTREPREQVRARIKAFAATAGAGAVLVALLGLALGAPVDGAISGLILGALYPALIWPLGIILQESKGDSPTSGRSPEDEA